MPLVAGGAAAQAALGGDGGAEAAVVQFRGEIRSHARKIKEQMGPPWTWTS